MTCSAISMAMTRIGFSGIIKFLKKSDAAGWALFIGRDNGIRVGSWRSSAFYLTTLIPRTR